MNQTPCVSWPLRHRGRLACTRSLERRTAGCVLFVTCYLLPASELGWSDTPRIKYIMFLPNTPLLLLATVVRGVNTLLGRADAVMATARGALPRKSITSSVPVLIPCCFAMSRKPDFQPAAQRQLGGLRTILRSLHPQPCAGSDIP